MHLCITHLLKKPTHISDATSGVRHNAGPRIPQRQPSKRVPVREGAPQSEHAPRRSHDAHPVAAVVGRGRRLVLVRPVVEPRPAPAGPPPDPSPSPQPSGGAPTPKNG